MSTSTSTSLPVDATPQPPLRIQRLSLTDFRAFPGPAPVHFELEGRNLLVYGENGAGKSSLFHALREFFALQPSQPLHGYQNVFSGQAPEHTRVEVAFNDGLAPACWWQQPASGVLGQFASNSVNTAHHGHYTEHHPTHITGGSDPRVMQAAQRRACLDYRALLDTNYKQGHGPVNLFGIAVEQLLHDYPVTVTGGTSSTIGALWAQVQASRPPKHTKAALARMVVACTAFNAAFRGAFAALVPLVNELMQLLGWHDVKLLQFHTPGITYSTAHRALDGQQLTPELHFRGHPLQTPQLFLNEARLSALGLAIYLAGRLACTPTTSSTALKLLVLDDVLIGLDHSNRLPVLDVLSAKFSDWQIVLLTHDRNWFDLARSHLSGWKCVEVYEGDAQATAPMPIVRATQNHPALALLKKARELMPTPYIEAAANYTRQAFELGARIACEVKGIAMPYHVYPKTKKPPLQAQDFLNKLKAWPGSDKVPKAGWDAALARLELLKNVVMNPYSHPNAPNIPKQEVQQAIEAVAHFLELVAKK